jgi:uncharacterized membrane protein
MRVFFSLIVVLLLAPAVSAQEDGAERTFEARVQRILPVPCDDGSDGCTELLLQDPTGLLSEPFTVTLSPEDILNGQAGKASIGDLVIVQSAMMGGERVFAISDIVRRTPLLALGILFVAIVLLFGRLSAARSLLGLLASFVILFGLIIPRLLAGDSPLLVSSIGSVLIAAVTLLLSHGWNTKSIASFAGITGSLLLTTLLALLFDQWAGLTGLTEETIFLLDAFPELRPEGLLLAGIVIGTLGVLDDVAVAQASAVLELRAANPRLTTKELYVSAIRIGRDHVAAAVNTLVLAYAGASLPLLLLFAGIGTGESIGILLSREILATEIVRTLVGSIGLLAAVPLTTFFASRLAVLRPPENLTGNHRH